MWDRIRAAGTTAWALVGITALAVVLLYIARYFHVVWLPLLLAGAIVFLLNPVVTWLHRRRIPRVVGTAITYVVLAALVGAVGWFVVPFGADQVDQLQEEWDADRIEEVVDDLHERSQQWGPLEIPTYEELQQAFGLGDGADEGESGGADEPEAGEASGGTDGGEEDAEGEGEAIDTEEALETLRTAREILAEVFEVMIVLFIAPIIAFYFLVDLPHIRRVSESLIPAGAKPEIMLLARRLNGAIGGFIRGQLMVALMVGIMVSIGLAIIDLRAWLIVGMVAGLFNIIPLIGPWVGAIPAITLALIDGDVQQAILAAVVMVVVQQIDNHLISPLVMQRAVNLHPAAVMIALLAGENLFGFVGLLLAVPAAAVGKILVGHLWRTYILGEPVDALAAEFGEAGTKPIMEPIEALE